MIAGFLAGVFMTTNYRGAIEADAIGAGKPLLRTTPNENRLIAAAMDMADELGACDPPAGRSAEGPSDEHSLAPCLQRAAFFTPIQGGGHQTRISRWLPHGDRVTTSSGREIVVIFSITSTRAIPPLPSNWAVYDRENAMPA